MLGNFGSIQHVIEQKNSEGTFFEISVLVETSSLQNYDIISNQFLSECQSPSQTPNYQDGRRGWT